jgi:hypothetical protein
MYKEAGWAPEPVLMVLEKRKFLLLPGFEPQTVQPIASCDTDYTILTPFRNGNYLKCPPIFLNFVTGNCVYIAMYVVCNNIFHSEK